jgi:hypothetical protein
MFLVSHDPRIRLGQQAVGNRLRDAHARHFHNFARDAARRAILAASQAENSPAEALDLFDWLFEDQLHRFSSSFADLWSFDASFREAAVRTMPARRP